MSEQKEQAANKYQKKIFTIPNILSFLRIGMIPVIIWLYLVKEKFFWAGCMLILSGITDTLDGIIARHFNMISDLGKALDPIADKLTQASMLFCLLFRFPLMLIPFIMMVVKEIFMGVTGLLIIKKLKKVPGANWHGKVATWVLYAAMVLHVFWYNIPNTISVVFIALCTFMITLSFMLYGIQRIKALKG